MSSSEAQQQQQPSRQSFTESAKDVLSMAAEKAREMTQYVTGAVLNTAEDVKEMATDDGEQKDVTKNESVDKEKKLQQPWDIGAPSSLPGPTESDGLKYGCKPASPEEISNSSRHALAHPTSSLKTF